MRNKKNCAPIIDGLLSEILTLKYKNPRHYLVIQSISSIFAALNNYLYSK